MGCRQPDCLWALKAEGTWATLVPSFLAFSGFQGSLSHPGALSRLSSREWWRPLQVGWPWANAAWAVNE
jgi:hypothetical protein